ncbi:hypothetical protein PIB30_024347 [Stylosanthes scabra]|uniref:Uncharacterized protein n=1 Tax=Stylosanthes scabra TaxID=79078 RepID=A0ABU6Z9E4_9FABA|nr:hypothetical protein [Stylosanthes scabra]
MEAVRARYNFLIQPVSSEECWTPTSCEGISALPIVRSTGRPRARRIKDHLDMIIGNKDATNCDQGNNFGSVQPPNIDHVKRTRKSKKKNLRIAIPADIGQANEVDFSQSAPTLDELAVPTSTTEPFATPLAHLPPARFRMKQPIVKLPITNINNPK